MILRKNRYKNKPNLALGGQFWYQNSPFKVNAGGDASFQRREAQSTVGDDSANIDLLTENTFLWDI